jgi:hypothetical protein
MTEQLLQYIWQTGSFALHDLCTVGGQRCALIRLGSLNRHQGADFLNAHVSINDVVYIGNVEVDLSSEEWYAHKHHLDPSHNSTVLHVVYHSTGRPIIRQDGLSIPELALDSRINAEMLSTYQHLAETQEQLPCHRWMHKVRPITSQTWLNSLGWDRMIDKSQEANDASIPFHDDWNQLMWWMLVGTFGLTQNKSAFRAIATSLPYVHLQRNADQLTKIEALLLGTAGLLDEIPSDEPYLTTLSNEWTHLSNKYNLSALSVHLLKFGKVRPPNFPTVRLALIAGLIHQFPDMSYWILNPQLFYEHYESVRTSPFWDTHYTIFQSSKLHIKKIGKQLANSIIINAIIPVSALYAERTGNENARMNCLATMEKLNAESNHIVDLFANAGLKAENALHSQAMIQLYNQYCVPKRCLNCSIGHDVLRSL